MNSLIFDLDGTLVDSASSVRSALSEACNINGIEPAMPVSEIKIGPPLDAILRSILLHEESARYDLLKASFVELYDKIFCTQCSLYPGAVDALSKASVVTSLFIVTNKRIIPTIKILNYFNILQIFKGVIGSDSVTNNGLPKSASIGYLIKEYGLNDRNCMYFGDTAGDALACQQAGVKFVHVPWGYDGAEQIGKFNCLSMGNWGDLSDFMC
ncbi:HAD family hydrolase [Porticoccaceae bacterium]|nr:HAD family hydrolase [Porticoccaceae bacterium]